MNGTELPYSQFSYLMKRFPEFELSYETISHKKVSNVYDICLAIPIGKKCFAWFTYQEENDVCYLLELNREKRVSKAKIIPTNFHPSLSLGTIVYGTLWEDDSKSWFVIEDINFYEGILMKPLSFNERLGFLHKFSQKITQNFGKNKVVTESSVVFGLPVIWEISLEGDDVSIKSHKSEEYDLPSVIPESINQEIAYPIHHIQYRSSKEIMPYLNVGLSKKILQNGSVGMYAFNNIKRNVADNKQSGSDLVKHPMNLQKISMDFSKPQYRTKTVFIAMADVQYDIYHLYAYGKNSQLVYYNVAYIPSYKTSVFMNGIFRNIRENKNLDYIEESDDEEDFQNMNEYKYVDINKKILLECVFNMKFKKWIPLRVVDSRFKVVHISKLIK